MNSGDGRSAFGVDHGIISKQSLGGGGRAMGGAFKAAGKIFKPVKKVVKKP